SFDTLSCALSLHDALPISLICPPYNFKISHICSFIYIKSLDMSWQLLSGKMIITFYNANRELECTGNMNNFFCDWTRICINKNFQFLHQSFYKIEYVNDIMASISYYT